MTDNIWPSCAAQETTMGKAPVTSPLLAHLLPTAPLEPHCAEYSTRFLCHVCQAEITDTWVMATDDPHMLTCPNCGQSYRVAMEVQP